MNLNVTLSKTAALTPVADQSGCTVQMCCPGWFDKRDTFSIANAPKFAANLRFSGDDLNFAARVLYAEASGSKVGYSIEELKAEKRAILHVMYFRLNRKGYPSNNYIATTFRMVGEAPKLQFESVARAKPKFTACAIPDAEKLSRAECADLQSCIQAVNEFVTKGPDFETYPFDEFRDVRSRPNWKAIAGNAFHLTNLGKSLLAGMKS